jgi:hypothetical protein
MSDKYKIANPNAAYFLTLTVVGWLDVFTRKNHKLAARALQSYPNATFNVFTPGNSEYISYNGTSSNMSGATITVRSTGHRPQPIQKLIPSVPIPTPTLKF